MRNLIRILLLACVAVSSHCLLHAAEDTHPNLKKHPLAGILDARLIPSIDAVRANASTDLKSAQTIKSIHPRAVTQTPKPEQLAVSLDTPVTEDSLKRIAATGATIVSSAPQWNTVCVMATISQIDALTKVGGVAKIKLQSRPRKHQQGIAPNQGDAVMQTSTLRSSSGLTGSGQILGFISDSVTDTQAVGRGSVSGSVPNAIVSNTTPQGTGDLPKSFQVVDFGPGGGSDEGEGMMEVAYDVAPGSSLAFGSCGNDQTQMATTVALLRTAAHCTVISDDIGFTDEPFFQEGPIAQAIGTNRSSGIIHFSAFGNDANQAIMTTYKTIDPSVTADNSNYPPDGTCFHDWGNGIGAYLPIVVPAQDSVSIILQWDQPYSSYNLGAGSAVDMDLYLCPSKSFDINSVVGSSENTQGTTGAPSGDPNEEIDYTNYTNSDQTFYLVLNHYAGSRTGSNGSNGNNIRIVFDDDGFGSMPKVNPVGGSSISSYGHPTSQYLVAVGAVDYQHPAIPENYTSKGGNVPYYFDTSGNPSATLRFAPDIVAPDGVDTSVFGSPDTDGDGYPNFYGTSCAAPNAAAASALLLQSAPSTTPAALLALLKSTATDITQAPTEDSSTPMTGNDVYSGAGLINAVKAYGGGNKPPTITSSLNATSNIGSTFSYTITASGPGTITFGATNIPSPLTITGATISGIPSSQGTFTIGISATNANGTTNANLTLVVGAVVPVTITSGPSANPNPVYLGNAIIFSVVATGSGRGLTTTWTFGDGQTANVSQVAHTYTSTGNFTVGLSIVDMNGQSTSATLQVSVLLPPIVFTQTPSATPTPTFTTIPIQFESNATGGVGTLTYAWNFGDGGTSTAPSPMHTYSVANSYNVTLTVTDSTNQTKSANIPVSVATYTAIAFTSQASAAPNPAGVGETISFSVAAVGNGTLTYSWKFGDGSSASTANVTHAYQAAGMYTATIKVVDGTQQTVSQTLMITANAPIVGVGKDSDGDGFSDSFEIATGSNPNDPNSVPYGLTLTGAPLPALTITKLSTSLNFAKTGHDSIALAGTLPIPLGFNAAAATIAFDIGGVPFVSPLNAKGQGGKAFKLALKSVKGVVEAQNAKFTLSLTNGTFAATLAQSGLTNETVKSTPVNVTVTAIFNGAILQTKRQGLFTAHAGKTGASK